MNLVPTTGPQDEATTDLIRSLRDDVIPAAVAETGLEVDVTGPPPPTSTPPTTWRVGCSCSSVRARPVVRAAGDGLPLAARAAQGRGHERDVDRRRLRRGRRRVPVGVGQPAARPRARPDQPLRADDALRRRVRVVHGLRGLPCLPSGRSTAARAIDLVADGLPPPPRGHHGCRRHHDRRSASFMLEDVRDIKVPASGSRSPSCSMPPSSACCWCRRRWSCSATATGGPPLARPAPPRLDVEGGPAAPEPRPTEEPTEEPELAPQLVSQP